MERSCCNCEYRERAMGDSHCLDCIAVKCGGGVVGHVYKNFKPIHVCSTCKHRKTNIRDNPCLNCNRRPLRDHWEAIDGEELS